MPSLLKAPSLLLPLLLSWSLVTLTSAFNAHSTVHVTHEATHVMHMTGQGADATASGYGFSSGGHASLSLSPNMYIGSSSDDLPDGDGDKFKTYFLLRKYSSAKAFGDEYELALANNDCMATSKNAASTDLILDVSDSSTWDTPVMVQRNFTSADAGLYFLTWQRCYPVLSDADHRVTFTFEYHFFNTRTDGKTDYLSTGEQPLPTMYLIFALIYCATTALWFTTIRKAKTTEYGSGISASGRGLGTSPGTQTSIKVHHIHYLMAILLLLKCATMFAESAKYHYIRWTGSGEAWSVIYYMFEFMKGIMLFVVILLIGSGWSFVKPFLNDKEKKTILVVLVLQVLDNIALAVVGGGEPGTQSYMSWEYTLRLIDLLCCGAILFPIVWQVRALEEAVAADEKAERTIRKLTLFRQFYVLVVCYIYFTRIIVLLIATMLTYKESWMEGFFNELATLMFYVTVGYKFRPQDRNPYLQLRGHEDSDDENDDDDDDFEGGGGRGGAISMRTLNEEEFGLPDDDEFDSGGPNAL
jgi:hypothetical protein